LARLERHLDPLVVAPPELTDREGAALRDLIEVVATTRPQGRLLVDLSRVRRISRRGALTLLSCQRLAVDRGLQLALRHPSREVRQRLDEMALTAAFAAVSLAGSVGLGCESPGRPPGFSKPLTPLRRERRLPS
jgi:anti-anti-sigma regulatory factor